MSEILNKKQFDLEDRTFKFAQNIRKFIKNLPKTISNFEDTKQLIRSSGSIGANYTEANESLSRKDFFMRIKICRKEAKESRYWLNLLQIDGGSVKTHLELVKEVTELMKIFGAILEKAKKV